MSYLMNTTVVHNARFARPGQILRWRCVFSLIGALLCFARPGFAGVNLLSTFQAGDGDWQLGTLAVGNVDSSPDLEIIVPYRNSSGQWYLDAFKWNGTRLPGFPYSAAGNPEINASPTLYDLDGDGRNEIIFMCGNSVIALRGDGSVYLSNSVSRANYIPNGGYQVVTNGFYWSATGAWIPNLPATAVFSSQFSPPMVADIDGNGNKEIITAWKIDPDSTSSAQDFNPFINDIWGFGEWGTVGESWSGGIVFFDALTGSKKFVYHFHQLVESGFGLGHADTGKALEVYVLNDSDSVVCFDKTKPHGFYGRGMLHKQFGKNQRLMSGDYQQSVDIYPVDLDGDGLAEVLVPTTQLNPSWEPSETILDDDGAILWRKWTQPVSFVNNHGWLNNACMIPVNPDHDNHIDVLTFSHSFEINYRYWNGIELVDHAGWPKNFYPYLPTPPVVGDVDGDGEEDIIIGTYDPAATPSSGNLHVFSLNGTEKFVLPVPGGVKHIPSLADVNGDGSLDVIYRSTLGRVYIQNFGATSATNVSWSTHRGNAQRDGNYLRSLFPPGTPLITKKESGYRRASLTWSGPAPNSARGYRIYRAEQAEGPFTQILTLAPNVTSYTDSGLKPGWQYFYEVAAIYPTNEVRSAPVAVLSLVNNNLIANGGFEENDNSHWDKWFSGDLNPTNMVCSTNVAYQGKNSMEIKLVNNGPNSSIKESNQYGIIDATIPLLAGTLYSFGCFFRSGGISQPSEHWLEWNDAKTSSHTNTPPPLPYPNYFTPHFVPGTGPSGWAYANRTFIMPPGDYDVELRHRYDISSPGSGSLFIDNVFLRPLPAPSDSRWQEWIRFGSAWRYFTGTPPVNWYATNFNDTVWPESLAKFGCGSGPTNLVTLLPSKLPSYYFRRTFVVDDTNLDELLLSAICSDFQSSGTPMRLFLNGQEVAASGIELGSDTGNDVRYYDLTPFLNLIHTGTNTIAVILNNTWQPSWDDVAFDLGLKAMPMTVSTAQPRFSSIQRDPSGVLLGVEAPLGTIWQVQSTAILSGLPTWQTVGLFTNNTANTYWFRDTSQNGPLAPQRYYRLKSY